MKRQNIKQKAFLLRQNLRTEDRITSRKNKKKKRKRKNEMN